MLYLGLSVLVSVSVLTKPGLKTVPKIFLYIIGEVLGKL